MTEKTTPYYLKKCFRLGLGGSGLLLLLLMAVFYGFYDRSDMFSDGTERLDCLSGNVEIYIDENQIRHINAANWPDQFRAVGYLQAATHLAEMDRLLRIASGQMAAAHGADFIDLDIAARRLGFSEKARQIQPYLSASAKSVLDAYCEGVNVFIATQKKSVARQFRLSGYQPLRWEPTGCLAILELQHWAEACSWDEKIVLYKTCEVFGQERTADGLPLLSGRLCLPQGEYKDAFFPDLNLLYQDGVQLRQATGLLPGRNETLVWAVAGQRPASDHALLGFESNYLDPGELLLDLVTPDMQLFGLFAPGIPIAVAGCNHESAWGYNRYVDRDVNLLIFMVVPSREQYLSADGWRNITRRTEQIEIKNKSDRMVTFFHIDQSTLLDYPRAATDSVVNAVAIAWRGVTAEEINGRIAVMLGRKPIEISGVGAVPAGLIFTSSSSVIKAAEIFQRNFGSAANTLTGFSGSDSLIARNFNVHLPEGLFYPDYQADRMATFAGLKKLLPLSTGADALCIVTIETDKYSGKIIAAVRPALCDTHFTKVAESEALRALFNWDGRYRNSSTGATVFRVFTNFLLKNIYADELNLVTCETLGQLNNAYDFTMRNLTLLLERGESSWFDDLSTPEKVEWQGEIIRRSFRESVNYLEKRYSSNLSEWQWDRIWRDFQVDGASYDKRPEKDKYFTHTLVMKAAGSQSEIFVSSVKPGLNAQPVNLFRDRFDIIRGCSQVLILKSSSIR